MTDSKPVHSATLRLVPDGPPGRSTRKARAFASEIARLHAEGYTLEAIRKALAQAGVHVSKSTVQREASRQAAAAITPARSNSVGPVMAQQQPPLPSPSPSPLPPTSALFQQGSGKDIAEAFVRDYQGHPLTRNKEPT